MLENIPLALIKDILGQLSEVFQSIEFSDDQVEISLDKHFQFLLNWSNDVPVLDLSTPTETQYSTASLHFSTKLQMLGEWKQNQITPISEEMLLNHSSDILILGDVGRGKTTTLRRICHKLLRDETLLPECQMPVLVLARKLSSGPKIEDEPATGHRLPDAILEALGVHVTPKKKGKEKDPIVISSGEKLDIATRLITELNAVLLVDGIDECSAEARKDLWDDLEHMSLHLGSAKIIATCRSAVATSTVEGFTKYEILPLDETKIQEIILKNTHNPHIFSQEAQNRPYLDLLERPLFLSHLITIYNSAGVMPEQAVDVYKQISMLCLRRWDESRRISRKSEKKSAYASFGPEKKETFLSMLAHDLLTTHRIVEFNSMQIERSSKNFLSAFSIPESDLGSLVSEIQSHTGLINQVGFDSYTFSHFSLQEYFAANHIVRQPMLEPNLAKAQYFPEVLAVAVALSSNPDFWFAIMVTSEHGIRKKWDGKNSLAFLSRLYLERPLFASSWYFAASFLVLIQHCRYRADENIIQALDECVCRFIGLPNVRAALANLLRRSSVSEVHCPPSSSKCTLFEVAPLSREYLKEFPKKLEKVLIDESLMQEIAEENGLRLNIV